MKCGSPTKVIEEMLKNGTSGLTLIANDTSYPDSDRGKLVVNRRVKKAIVAHIGTNPETGKQMHDGEIEVVLTPMGTLVENPGSRRWFGRRVDPDRNRNAGRRRQTADGN